MTRRTINHADYELIHIFPVKNEDKYDLCIFGEANIDVSIQNLEVKYDNQIVFTMNEYHFCNTCWYVDRLPNYSSVEKITLSYWVDADKGLEKYEEFFYTKDIDIIYNHIMRINSESNL